MANATPDADPAPALPTPAAALGNDPSATLEPAPALDAAPGTVLVADPLVEAPAAQQSTYDRLMDKLFSERFLALGSTAQDRLWGWLGPLLVALFAGVIRIIRLGTPNSLVFDETYYVKGAYTLLREGYEANWPDEPNEAWNAGQLDGYQVVADYVVHPPLGKWMIAFGMWVGDPHNPAFWRLSTAIVSVIAVFLIARTARSMLGSTTFGIAAGALFAIDGAAIVHARTGLLDSFLMFFVVVAFALLIKDREVRRTRLARLCAGRLDQGLDLGRYGPRLGWSWWRFCAALSLGLATGVKWSGAYYVAVFCVMAVIWDAGARRSVGVKGWLPGAFWRDAVPSALIMVPTAIAGYALAWTSWFISPNSYDRQWSVNNPTDSFGWLPDFLTPAFDAIRSLVHYHQGMLTFHTGLSSEHTYQSSPWGWMAQIRPTSFYWNKVQYGENGCLSSECASAVTSIGNPLIWWLGCIAFLVALFLLITRGDWRAGAIVAGIGAGWVPWLFFPERTIFTFYTIAFAPFVYLAVAYLGFLLWQRYGAGPVSGPRVKRALCWSAGIIAAVSVFFYPIWTAIQVPMWFWQLHMWLPTWI